MNEIVKGGSYHGIKALADELKIQRQEGRNSKGLFVKGNKLQVSNKPITKELMERAIENVEKRHDTRLIEHVIERAYISDKVLMKVIDKFVPNLTIAERDIKPIQIAIKNYYASPDVLPPRVIETKAEIVYDGEEELDDKKEGDK